MTARRLACVAALAAVIVTTGPVRAGAASSTLLEPGAERVLIVSTPTVGWSLVNEQDTPNLWELLRTAATGNLTARTLGRSDLASGYLTFGAGTRAAAPRSPLDGAGMEPTERYGEVTARDAFALNTGLDVDEGVLQVGIEPILASSADEQIDAVIGALGNDLAAHGYSRAVIANGDGSYPDQPAVMKRYAVNALMDDDGTVSGGRVGADLLEDHTSAPFGVRYDVDEVVRAFREVWQLRSVVLVESSDLVRADAFGLLATPERAAAALREAVRRTDQLLGDLLAEVDLARDAVVLVSPTRARGTVLSAAVVHAPGVPAGLLSSASTRRPGFVLLGDVAPTVLALAGLPRDKDMTGSRFTVGRAMPLETRLDRLQDSTSAAVFRDRVRGPVTLTYAAIQALLLGATAFAIARKRVARWSVALTVAALAMLAFVPCVYLARVFPLHESGTLVYAAFLAAVALGIAVVTLLVTRARAVDALLVVLGLVVIVLVADVLTGARLQLSSAFGYSATIGIRVAGFGNIAYAVLGAAAILVSGLVAHRIPGSRGAWLGTGVMVVALVVDIAPFWGSDVGGVLSLVPAFGVTAALLLGVRVRVSWRIAALAGAVTLFALAAVTAFDLSRPADARTHLGRLAQQVADEGISPFTNTIARKVDANLETWSTSEWRLVLAGSVLFLAYLAVRQRPRLRDMLAAVPELRASLIGIGLLAVLGYAFNDSGVMVPGAALSITCATLVVLLVARERQSATPEPSGEVTPTAAPVPSP